MPETEPTQPHADRGRRMMTMEEWIAREIAKLPPLTEEKSAEIADIVLSYIDQVRHKRQKVEDQR